MVWRPGDPPIEDKFFALTQIRRSPTPPTSRCPHPFASSERRISFTPYVPATAGEGAEMYSFCNCQRRMRKPLREKKRSNAFLASKWIGRLIVLMETFWPGGILISSPHSAEALRLPIHCQEESSLSFICAIAPGMKKRKFVYARALLLGASASSQRARSSYVSTVRHHYSPILPASQLLKCSQWGSLCCAKLNNIFRPHSLADWLYKKFSPLSGGNLFISYNAANKKQSVSLCGFLHTFFYLCCSRGGEEGASKLFYPKWLQKQLENT